VGIPKDKLSDWHSCSEPQTRRAAPADWIAAQDNVPPTLPGEKKKRLKGLECVSLRSDCNSQRPMADSRLSQISRRVAPWITIFAVDWALGYTEQQRKKGSSF